MVDSQLSNRGAGRFSASDDDLSPVAHLPWGQVLRVMTQPSVLLEQSLKAGIDLAAGSLSIDGLDLWLYQPNQLQIYSSCPHRDRRVTMLESGYVDSAPWLNQHQLIGLDSVVDAPELTPLVESGLLPPSGALLFAAIVIADRRVGSLWFQRSAEQGWDNCDRAFASDVADMVQIALRLDQSKTMSQQNPLVELGLQQAEKAWQESQQLIQRIAETSTSILYLRDVESHRLVYANPQLEKILGYTLEELQTAPKNLFSHLIHPEDRAKFEQHLSADSLLLAGDMLEGEYRFQAKDGGWRWLLLREAVLHQQDSFQTQAQICGTATDITCLKQTELALEQANQQLTLLSTTDALTHLANRRRFNDFLDMLWQQSDAEVGSVAMMLCDIDYFKQYNDTYGHPAGDRCLQDVSRVLRYAINRKTDLVARYGGEEFAIVLPKTNLKGACIIAQRIRQEIAALKIPHRKSQVSDYLTLSMGIVATHRGQVITPTQLIDAADKALYQAKTQGRDRYCTTTLDTPSPPLDTL